MSYPEFCLAAFGQEWRIRFLPARGLVPRGDAEDAWRAAAGDVFIEVPFVEGERRAELERRLVAAIGGQAYRGVV